MKTIKIKVGKLKQLIKEEAESNKLVGTKVKWTDRNYKEFSKTFKEDTQGAPENSLVLAKKFIEKLETKDKADQYGLWRSVGYEMIYK